MSTLLLAAHHGDAELFACWTLLREKPEVLICCYPGHKTNARRVLETAAAMAPLGCVWSPLVDEAPNWAALRKHLVRLSEMYERCYAPVPRFSQNGHDPAKLPSFEHEVIGRDKVGAFAAEAFKGRCIGYLTETRWGGKDTSGTEVEFEPHWPMLKLNAIACHKSQIMNPKKVDLYLGDLHEFYA